VTCAGRTGGETFRAAFFSKHARSPQEVSRKASNRGNTQRSEEYVIIFHLFGVIGGMFIQNMSYNGSIERLEVAENR
jgi:hypothetical protein